jgi:hypothetical protein
VIRSPIVRPRAGLVRLRWLSHVGETRQQRKSSQVGALHSSRGSMPQKEPELIPRRSVRPPASSSTDERCFTPPSVTSSGAHLHTPAPTKGSNGWVSRFDDRWRRLMASVVPRFRTFDDDLRLIDPSLRRIILAQARAFATMPCVLPLPLQTRAVAHSASPQPQRNPSHPRDIRRTRSSVVPTTCLRAQRRRTMTEKMSGDGRRWKKWLWVYLAAGAVAYLVVYLVFFHHGGGGSGFGY